MDFPNFNKEKGFTMLEVIVAVFILTVGIIGAYFAFVDITSTTTIISSRLTAAYLGQEGVEIIRNLRDKNWLEDNEWTTGLDSYCDQGCEADYRAGTVDDDGSSAFKTYGGGTFLNLDTYGFYTYDTAFASNATKFKRKITIISQDIDQDSNSDLLSVVVSVSWWDMGKEYSFTIEENLYNWR